MHVLQEIAKLPLRELDRVWILYLSIFKIAYHRRFEKEKDNPDKWWYWDLGEEENFKKITMLQK
ncbi:hypothetical protein SAMN05444266_106377 [Chitinophaga jiangningensis]|uniref:Uncharacterized protein n=2 Tax=Chitinophaga jiangningensis TaxID=1419482 RepID=A0A1M7G2P8_9BACT|nr:hypothetical protein SAMN05444266_106377 [Chitinophaga jiangningensis]